MTFANGDDFIIELEGTEISCGRSLSLSINNEQIDTTSKCDTPWRQLLEGGIRSMSVSFAGIFNDSTVIALMQQKAFVGSIDSYKIKSGLDDTYEGPFQIATFERSGEYNDSEMYSVSLESAGEIIYGEPVLPKTMMAIDQVVSGTWTIVGWATSPKTTNWTIISPTIWSTI